MKISRNCKVQRHDVTQYASGSSHKPVTEPSKLLVSGSARANVKSVFGIPEKITKCQIFVKV